MDDLFASERAPTAPLAERLRPTDIDDVIGQDHLTSPTGIVRRMTEARTIRSMVLWGPPGSGKTTMVNLMMRAAGLAPITLRGSTATSSDVRSVLAETARAAQSGRCTPLVVDQIHRLGRTLQEQLLAPIETGALVLIGCTTEHVAYDLIDGLLSRILVLKPKALSAPDLGILMSRTEKRLGRTLALTDPARQALVTSCNGDARRLLNAVESVLDAPADAVLDVRDLEMVAGHAPWRSDKDRDLHYDRMSAIQKSVRASDPDAALYWFAQMLEAGEDMDFVIRRLLIMATEEVGLADPMALVHATAAADAHARLGHKGGIHAIAQAIVHLASSPKSNAVHRALDRARAIVRSTGDRDPRPISINHPTRAIATRRGYVDDHDREDAFAGQDHWPEGVTRRRLYDPSPRGMEAATGRRLDTWIRMRG